MKEVVDGLLGEYFWVVGHEAYPVSESNSSLSLFHTN